MVAMPLLCTPGIIESNRLLPPPLKVKCELVSKLVFEERAVVVTVNIATALSETPTGRLVESSSPIVTLVGKVNVGPEARAAQTPIARTMSKMASRNNFLAGANKVSAPSCFSLRKDINFITIEFTASKRHDLLHSVHGSSFIGITFPGLSTKSSPGCSAK